VKLFVTGGSSPLGDHVVPRLLAHGHDVACLARSTNARDRVGRLGADPVAGDLLADGWQDALEASDCVVHLAGIRIVAPLLAVLPKDEPVIVVSSASAANPAHPLAAAVRAGEEAVFAHQTTATVLRPTMIYGSSRDRNMQGLARIVKWLPLVPGITGGGLIQPVAAIDVADAIVGAIGSMDVGMIELGGPEAVTLGQLVTLLADILGRRVVDFSIPVAPLAGFARRTRLGGKGRALHALEMLSFDRTVGAVPETLLGRPATPLRRGLEAAVVTYGLAAKSP
jgi:nucleoside-diphosphate-sugar epimerase